MTNNPHKMGKASSTLDSIIPCVDDSEYIINPLFCIQELRLTIPTGWYSYKMHLTIPTGLYFFYLWRLKKKGLSTKDKILKETKGLVLQNGYVGTTIDMILEKTSITKGAFFYQ